MHNARRFDRWNGFLFGLLAFLLLVPAGASGAIRRPSKDPNGSARSELSPISVLKMDRYRPQMFARPAELCVGTSLGSLREEERSHPSALLLPNGALRTDRGALHRQLPSGVLERGLAWQGDRDSIRQPQQFRPGPYVVQLQGGVLGTPRGPKAVREIEALGVEAVSRIPRNGFLVRINRFEQFRQLAANPNVRHLEAYYDAFKISASLGCEARPSRRAAELPYLTVQATLFPGGPGRDLENFVRGLGARVIQEFNAGHYSRLLIDRLEPQKVPKLVGRPEVRWVESAQPYFPLSTTTPDVIQTGHYLEKLLPMFRLGIDGSTQTVAVSDDGVSLDSTPFAHSLDQADLDPDDGDPEGERPDVGVDSASGRVHRKVESYRTVQEINEAAGRTGGDAPPPGAGDFLSCDAPEQGFSTHGQIVSALAVGNPTELGIRRDNLFAFFGFWQTGLEFDGVARGARLIFQDGHDTPTGPTACFSFQDSNVTAGCDPTDPACVNENLVGDVGGVGGVTFGQLRALLHEAAFRLDLAGDPAAVAAAHQDPSAWVPHPRGARVHIIPFGVPNFTIPSSNRHDSYNAETFDIDDFSYRNRESLVVLAAGNDGTNRSQSIAAGGQVVPVNAADPTTYQIVSPATAKNGLVMGSHAQDATVFSVADDVEDPNNFTSKGPATFNSKRVAPLLLAPGSETGDNADYSAPNYSSLVAFRSNDNNQAGPIATVNDFDGARTDFLDEANAGTSFSAAAAGGAAALVRDYFAKGFYPSGSGTNAPVPTISGALVKAAMIASANFEDLDIKFFNSRFSNEQGYGRIQLVSSLPLANYPEAVLPDPLTHAEAPGVSPTTPLGVQVADEYFNGGQGLGVITDQGTRTYTLNVIDGSRELRVGLAWADVPGDALVHDLDLEVFGPPNALIDADGIPDRGVCAGTTDSCNTDAECGGSPRSCVLDCSDTSHCRRLAFRGNMFVGPFAVNTVDIDDPRFIADPTIDPFKQPCNEAIRGRDACNPTEGVFLSATQFANEDVGLRAGLDRYLISDLLPGRTEINIGPEESGTDFRTSFLGEGDGILNNELNGGLNLNICDRFRATNGDIDALCAAPRDLNLNGGDEDSEDRNGDIHLQRFDGVPTGAWEVRVFARDTVTMASEIARNAPAIVPADQKTADASSHTGFAYNANTRPFALLAAGGFLPPGSARAAFDRHEYDCADRLVARVIDSNVGVTPGAISTGTTVEVFRGTSTTPIDSETGLSFSPFGGIAGAFEGRALSVTRSNAPINNSGTLEVQDGDRLRVRYASARGEAQVSCAPALIASNAFLFGPDEAPLVSGGCDNDRFMDAGEMIAYSVNLMNVRPDRFVHEDLKASLVCTNPTGNISNPCQHLQILNSPVRIGKLPSGIGPEGGSGIGEVSPGQSPTFNIFVRESVKDVPPADRKVNLSLVIEAATQDLNLTRNQPLVIGPFAHAIESDLEEFHYSTDYPNGSDLNGDGTPDFVLRDLNRDGAIQPPLPPRLAFPGLGQVAPDCLTCLGIAPFATYSELPQETQKFRSLYETGTNVLDILPDGKRAGGAPAGLGEDIFDPPFNFDAVPTSPDVPGPAAEGFDPFRSPHSRPGTGPQAVTWFFSQNGVCGFQTQQAGRAGTWHAGGDPRTAVFGTNTDKVAFPYLDCPPYGLPEADDGINGNQFWDDALLTPVIHKVNQAPDERGFDFRVRQVRFAWNENVELLNDQIYLLADIDTDLDRDGNIDLLNLALYSSAYQYQHRYQGPITQSNDLAVNANLQTTFGPVFDPNGSVVNPPDPPGPPLPKPTVSGDEVGVARPLPEADLVLNRFLLPFPARDANPATPAFDRAAGDRSTPAGPVRNREAQFGEFSVGSGLEDFWGPFGNRFQAAMSWFFQEDVETNDADGVVNQPSMGWTIDDLVWEWDESHPAPQDPNGLTSCGKIGLTEDRNGNGMLDCGADGICGTGDAGDEDLGLDNTAGTSDFGEGDNQLTTNGIGGQCASLVVERQNLYDCDTALDVTVQDLTPPDIYRAADGTFCRDPATGRFTGGCDGVVDGFVVVNARTFTEPRGEEFRLLKDPSNPSLFRGQVPVSSVLNVNDPQIQNRGNVFIRPVADFSGVDFPLIFTYQDLDCDGDADGVLGEDNFRDIDGDGVTNFDNDFDARPDDNCFDPKEGTDVFNRKVGMPPMQPNDGFGQVRDAINPVTGAVIRAGVFVGEYIDADKSLTYTPIEDRALGATNTLSFNGILDPGEDVGVNLIADANEDVEGPDRDPGVNNVDDDKDGTTDEADETGTCGSDDRNGDNFRLARALNPDPALNLPDACPGGTEKDGKMQGDIARSPDPVGDICDLCPLIFDPAQVDGDADGVSDACEDSDLDNDGFENGVDNCPTVSNPGQEDADMDTIGNACDGGLDPDRDGVDNEFDNCPQVRNGNCTANPLNCDIDGDGLEPNEERLGFQRDIDFDGIGDACDPEDFDGDEVLNIQDNCATIPNPRDPATGFQEDTDRDSLGDSRATLGPVAGAFCDPDSTDDDNSGTPDDLVSFGILVGCVSQISGNLGEVSITSISIDDSELGDNDKIADPGEGLKIFVSVFNGRATPLTNVRVGLGSTSDSVACVPVGEVSYGTIPASSTMTNTVPFEAIITRDLAAQLREDLPIVQVLAEPKRAVFTATVHADQIAGTRATQIFSLNLDLDLDPAGVGQTPFTLFESFESESENNFNDTAGPTDPRDVNDNGKIDCGADNDCTTITSCTISPTLCDEWTLDLFPPGEQDGEPGLHLDHEELQRTRSGAIYPPARGHSEIVSPGHRNFCPSDIGLSGEGIRPDAGPPFFANDWHIHTPEYSDIKTPETGFSNEHKAKRGFNSLHFGRHVIVPGQPTLIVGDTYCLQCSNAFIMDRTATCLDPGALGCADARLSDRGGLNLNNVSEAGQPLRLSFWHIAEMCDHECFDGFIIQTADEVVAMQLRADNNFDALVTEFGPWERIEPNVNPYDGRQDTEFTTPTYEPPDDINPLGEVDKVTTMCTPLNVYIAHGSAKGTDAVNCTDADGDGWRDCGWVAARTNPAERRPDRISRGERGSGVWVFTSFDLDRYAGRHVQFRWLTTTLDGRDQFTSYLETTSGPFNEPVWSNDDGWYVDDVRISGLVPNELSFSIDRVDGVGQCSVTTSQECSTNRDCPSGETCVTAPGGIATCPELGTPGPAACTVTGAAVVADPASTEAPGTTVNLRADGNVLNCARGESQVQWFRDGVPVGPPSSARTLVDSPNRTTLYEARIFCSTLPTCEARVCSVSGAACSTNADCGMTGGSCVLPFKRVFVYDGATSESIVLRWKTNSPPTLVFNAVQQIDLSAPGQFPGYDVFRGCVRLGAAGTTCAGQLGLVATAPGSGIASSYGACFAPGLAQQTPGMEIEVLNTGSETPPPPTGNAFFYLAGHARPSPEALGFTSNNKLRRATVPCGAP